LTHGVALFTPMLDRNMMIDDQGRVMTDTQLEDLLEYVYQSITTGGLNKIKDFNGSAPW